MKFSTVILPFLTGVLAKPLAVRDGTSVIAALNDVDAKVNALNAAITATPLDADALDAATAAVNDAITAGIATVGQSAALTEMDALGLTAPTQTLATDTGKAIDNLIAIKDQLDALGTGCKTLDAIQQQFTLAQTFATDIVALVPSALQSIAQGLSAGIATAIQKGVDAYSSESCDATTAPATTAAAPTTTAAAATTTAAAATTTAAPAATTEAASSAPAATTEAASSAPAATTESAAAPTTSDEPVNYCAAN